MNYVDNGDARILSIGELIGIMEQDYYNPTVRRLMFLETAGKGGTEGKLFPCYLEAWKGDESLNTNPDITFQACLVQSIDGLFSMLRVHIHSSEIGVTKRFWNLPPGEAIRKNNPFLETLRPQ
ncbi:MAG: hypothetical protein II545_06725 [Lachnospiraceae bacterium]|nr:hypothetical protein [Lachnospiraceae bacterium]